MFGLKKKNSNSYDKENQIPAMRISICTGEKVAGFVDKASGKFTDVMLVKNDSDLVQFCKEYQVDREEIKRVY